MSGLREVPKEVKRLQRENEVLKNGSRKYYNEINEANVKVNSLENIAFKQKNMLDTFVVDLRAKDVELNGLRGRIEMLEREGLAKDSKLEKALVALKSAKEKIQEAERERVENKSKAEEESVATGVFESEMEKLKEKVLKLEEMTASLYGAQQDVKELKKRVQELEMKIISSHQATTVVKNEGEQGNQPEKCMESGNANSGDAVSIGQIDDAPEENEVSKGGEPTMPHLEELGLRVSDDEKSMTMPDLECEEGHLRNSTVGSEQIVQDTASHPVLLKANQRTSLIDGMMTANGSDNLMHSEDRVPVGSSGLKEHLPKSKSKVSRKKSRNPEYKTKRGGPVKCWMCDILFTTGEELRTHVKLTHGDTAEKYGWCYCGRVFHTLEDVRNHRH